ncbi:hypothetical protein Bca52824_030873 [Brassica carinata]|uniref:Uncharacterized protein n=1 Tax=Brassica carinata TaxID=52824 RepID=A0A8X7V4U3_BRACI|nr:hypothetical protein Bca52824_030873 [Brassica carinata]
MAIIQSVSARSSSPLPQSQVGEAKLAVFIPVSGESQLASTTVAKLDDPWEKESLLLPLSSSQKLGAWAKPLPTSSDQSAVTVLMQTTKNLLSDLSSESQWPSLSEAHSNQRRKLTFPTSVGEKNGESVDGIQDASKKLSEVKGSNRFANLASMEEKVAPKDVSSPSHSPVPTVVNDPAFVFNFSSPASQVMISEFGDPLAISSQGPTAATDTNIEGATSSYNSDMAQKSRGGRCLKTISKTKRYGVVHHY